MRTALVHLVSGSETITETVEASVLATDAALVDMARRQAGVSTKEFRHGEVLAQ